MVESLVSLMAESRPAGLRAMILAMAEADLRDVLPRITVPTLLLVGEEDVRSPLSVVEELHEQIPGSTLVVMPDVGHQSIVETPERSNSEVRAFSATTDRKKGARLPRSGSSRLVGRPQAGKSPARPSAAGRSLPSCFPSQRPVAIVASRSIPVETPIRSRA